MGASFRIFRGFFWSIKKTNFRRKKIRENLLLLITWLDFTDNDHMTSVFVIFKNRTWNPPKIISRSEVGNPDSRKFVSSRLEKRSKPRQNKLPRKFISHGIMPNCFFFNTETIHHFRNKTISLKIFQLQPPKHWHRATLFFLTFNVNSELKAGCNCFWYKQMTEEET